MPQCAVFGCSNRKGLVLHAFPKDTLRTKAWIIKCRRKDFINTNTARVCGDHFDETSYKRDLEHELLNLPLRKVLKDDAIPNKNLPTLNERSDLAFTSK